MTACRGFLATPGNCRCCQLPLRAVFVEIVFLRFSGINLFPDPFESGGEDKGRGEARVV